jgi:hypothetical protein
MVKDLIPQCGGVMVKDLIPQCGGEEFKSQHLQPRLPWLLR